MFKKVKTAITAAWITVTFSAVALSDESKTWIIDSQKDWQSSQSAQTNLKFQDGLAIPLAKTAVFQSSLKSFSNKRSAEFITLSQSPVWHNWQPVKNLGPKNLKNAPVFLSMGPQNYWIFGRYGASKNKDFNGLPTQLKGFNVPLKTTPFPNQYDAPGGLQKDAGGYHAWQSRDMVNWVHHGSVTPSFASMVTSAEYVSGNVYIYYDFPNDQDPHLYIDDDLMDGLPGKNMGMAFKDPSDGSDTAFIRDLDGNFHVIYEDWSPINASKHAWDSPLAGHAVSKDGIKNFEILKPAVDERTNPTGKFAEYAHPHWYRSDRENYPGRRIEVDVPQHKLKAGDIRAFAKYEIHEPEQNAYGDWASIAIGGQYYLFGDFDPAGKHSKKDMSVAWFTSSSINEPFTFSGNIGQGHPDPDIMFAEGQFYLVTQMKTDYVSPGPWVDGVEVRVGVDTNNNRVVDNWTKWEKVKEQYDYIPGFAKQIAKTPAQLDLSNLPDGYGFQFEVRLTDTTKNDAKPILDRIALSFK